MAIQAVVAKVRPQANDYIHFHVTGAVDAIEAQEYVDKNVPYLDDANVEAYEYSQPEKDGFEVVASGNITTSNFYVGQTF